jgi:hypothetical protein
MKRVSHFVLVIVLLSCFESYSQNNRITIGCKQYFLSGSNVAWSNADNGFGNGVEDHFGWDFATRPWGGGTSGYSATWWDNHFAMMQAQGANCARVWVHADGRADPEYDGSGNITGSDPVFNAAMDDMLNKAKNHNILVILCLWDAVVLNSGPHGKSVMTSQTTNYINNVLTPMANRYKNQCNLLAYDIINEPEAMYENSQATKAELQIFAAKCAEAIHAVDPNIKVTVGSKCLRYNSTFSTTNSVGNWWTDAQLQAAYPAGNTARTKLDFYSPHFYYWMNDPGNGWDFAPYKRDALLGGALGYALDKPAIVGETAYNPTSPGVVTWTRTQMFTEAYNKNFAGILFWASSAASGHGDSWGNFSSELKAFRDAHIPEVDFACGGGGCCTQPNMGTNKTTCGGGITFPYLLNSNTGSTTNKTYTWKLNNVVIGGATSSTYNAPTAGTYVVIVDSGLVQHCILTDTIVLSNTLATPNLGPNFNLCTPAFKDLDGNDYGSTPVTFTWQKNTVTISGETNRYLLNVRTAGTYTVIVSAAGCSSVNASVTATASAGLPVPTDGCRTGTGVVNMSVAGSSTYKWYDAQSNGSLLTTGFTYSPALPCCTTITYWVEDAASVAGQVGPTSQIGGGFGRNPVTDDYRFRVNFNTGAQAVTINSVKVWAWFNATGTTYYVNIRILDQAGTVMNTVSVPVTSASTGWNPKVLPIGITVPAGVTSWKMDARGTTSSPYCDLYYVSSGASYSYNSTPTSGMLTITGHDATWDPNGYSYFYDWQISTGTGCGRTPVVGTTNGCSVPAPVSLLNFSASIKDRTTELTWATVSENNNSYFEIERSTDKINFKSIGRVNGSGKSLSLIDYSFEDLHPLKETSYYRLKQVDIDGSSSYSEIISVQRRSNIGLNVYPHPIRKGEVSQFDFTISDDEEIELVITDVLGNKIFSKNIFAKKGLNHFEYNNELSSGLYILSLHTQNETLIQKIIVN